MSRTIKWRGRLFPSQVALARRLGTYPMAVSRARRKGRGKVDELEDRTGGSGNAPAPLNRT